MSCRRPLNRPYEAVEHRVLQSDASRAVSRFVWHCFAYEQVIEATSEVNVFRKVE